MVSFQYWLGVSATAVISLLYPSTAIAQQFKIPNHNRGTTPSSPSESILSETGLSAGSLLRQSQNSSAGSFPLFFPLVGPDQQWKGITIQSAQKGNDNGIPTLPEQDKPQDNVPSPESEETLEEDTTPSPEPERLQNELPAAEQELPEADNFLEPVERKPIENTAPLDPSSNPLFLPTEPKEVRINDDEVYAITLEQALKLARRNSERLRDARLNVAQAQEQLREAQGAKFPTISLQSQLQRNTSAINDIAAQSQAFAASGVTTDLNTTLQLDYDIYTGGQRSAQIERAKSQLQTQKLALEQTAQQLRLDVTNAYYDLQEADAQVRIAEASVQEAKRVLRDAKLLKEAGLGTRFDVLQAEVRLANEEQNLTRAKAQQRTSRRELVRILSLGQQVELKAANPPEVAGTWDLSLEESIVQAYQNRAELEQQLEQREIGEANQTIALSNIRPQVNLFARYNVLERIDDPSATGTGEGLSIGAQVQWTFFDGGQAKARAKQAEQDVAIAENQFSQTRNQIRQEVEQAFFQLEANQQNIETAKLAVQQAQESLRLARLRFQAGVGTQSDVITAQRDLTDARGNLLTAIIDYNRSLAALQRAVSNLPDNRLFDTP